MPARLIACAFLIIVFAAAVCARPPQRSVTGYIAIAEGDTSAYFTLADHIDCFSVLAPTFLSYDAGAVLTDHTDKRLIRFAHSHGVKVTPLVNIAALTPADAAHLIFADSDAVARNVDLLLKSIVASGGDGINVDIEGVAPADRPLYNAFIAALCKAFHEKHLTVSLDLPAKYEDDPNATWPGFADYAFLGKHADQLQLMCYDEHWAPGDPGPVGSLPWVRKVLRYAVSVAPRSKVVLGVPLYGYDWPPTGPAGSLLGRQADELLREHGQTPKWDPTTEAYSFQYLAVNGDRHTVFYEHERTLRARLDAARQYGIAGISIWRLGDESDTVWSPLKRFRDGL